MSNMNSRIHYFSPLIFAIAMIIFPAVIEAGSIRLQNYRLLRNQSLLISQADTDELFETPKSQSQPEPKPLPSAESENKSVNKDFLKFDKPKSYLVTFGMDFLPLAALIGGSIYCSSLPTSEDFRSKRSDCFQRLHVSSLGLLGLGTLPSDIYLRSNLVNIMAVDFSKILIGGAFVAFGFYATYFHEENDLYHLFLNGAFIPGITITSLIYFGEMISHGVKVYKINKYVNEKNQEKNTVIIPMVWKNQVGLALFRSF